MAILVTTIFSAFFLAQANSAILESLKSDFFSIYKNIAVETRQFQNKPVTADNVTYYLFTKNNLNQYTKIDSENLNALASKGNKLVFIIHGWCSSREAEWYEDLKNAFLTTYSDYLVVQVDWKDPAHQFYYVSSINTYDVAGIIADLIMNLNENYNFPLDDILLVGHSLGGQISGFVGKKVFKLTGKKLPRIVALDPAGPLFTQRPDDKRLNRTDAEIVQVIHSDGDAFGFKDACGTIDFFPNGGNSQPGCKRIHLSDITSVAEPVVCDHRRANEYFVEAVLNPKEFVAKRCIDWDTYKEDKCDKEEVTMGDLTAKATGRFYLETNKEKPFARKLKRGRFSLPNILKFFHH